MSRKFQVLLVDVAELRCCHCKLQLQERFCDE